MRKKKRKYRRGLGEADGQAAPASAQRAKGETQPKDFSQYRNAARGGSAVDAPRQKEEWLNETDKKVIKVAAYVTTGLVLTGIGWLIVRTKIRKAKRLKAEKETLSDNTPENFAKRLIMAFDNDGWWGTDVEAVRRIFAQIPSKEVFVKVSEKYSDLSSSKQNLYADLEDELTSTEFYEMQSMLATKPEKTGQSLPADAWKTQAKMFARRLNSAVNYKVMGFPATDEDAIRQVFTEIPTQKMFWATFAAYQSEYGVRMDTELDEDISASDFDWRAALKKKKP